MGAQFLVDGDDVTVRFEWNVPLETGQDVVFNVAEALWVNETDDEGVILNPFSEASAQEKLDVAFGYAQMTLVNKANSAKSNKAQAAARELEAASEYDFGE